MYKQINLFSDAARNISQIKDELGNNSDLLIREFDIQIKKNIYKLAVLFISGLADENKLESLSNELNELIYLGCCDNQRSSKSFFNKSQIGREDLFSRLKTSLLCNSKIIEGSDLNLYTARYCPGIPLYCWMDITHSLLSAHMGQRAEA